MNYKKFEDLNFIDLSDEIMVGKKCRIFFENGFGASIVSHTYSYGGKAGLYEIAILDKNGEITYDTPITSDVIGYLNENDVTEILEQIQKL